MPAISSAQTAPGTALGGGRYVLGSLVRTGVFAHHHEAIDQSSGGEVAVFVIRDEILASGNAIPAVVDLARAAAAIDSPQVARVIDAGADGPTAYVVTEKLEGHTVRELLERKRAGSSGGFAPTGAYPIALGVLSALAAAHGHTVHGAVTLDAVHVAQDGSLKLADFGLAAALPHAAAAGTLTDPSGIAPERGQGQPPGPPGDVFAAGALLYQLLTGEPPVKGCAPPSQVAGVPAEIDTLVLRCMAGAPEQRPSSAEVARELHRIATSAKAAQAAPAGAAAAGAGGAGAGSGAAGGDDDALAAALADTWERWLVCKDKLDYGPYSTAELVEQIRADQVLPQHIVMDKDTGDRTPAGDHPLFAGVVERAAQQRDDRRRAGAEEQHVKQERRRVHGICLKLLRDAAAAEGRAQARDDRVLSPPPRRSTAAAPRGTAGPPPSRHRRRSGGPGPGSHRPRRCSGLG